jgi:UDPglucose 6-dehydrogenase
MKKKYETNNVSIIGIGKLGACMVAGMASRGFKVVCVDIDTRTVDCINRGEAPVQETGLEELISSNKQNIRATTDYNDAVQCTDITFVIIPTPNDERGAFSTKFAEQAFKEIGRCIRNKSTYHVVVLTSTVLPGATRQILIPILEGESGKKCGVDFGLCYSPEFIALGTVIRDFLNPDFYLVGQYDDNSGEALEYINSRVSLNNAKCMRMSIENAELAKIAVNSFVTMKISFANMLSDICERIPGGDIDVVSDALGMDSRIGRKYLTGGLGFGGPCFPRDNIALAFIGEQLGVDCSLPKANHQFNQQISVRAVQKLKSILKHGSTVSVLGLAYKPLSHVIEESSGIYLCRELSKTGYKVLAHDPLANSSARIALENGPIVLDDLDECLSQADAIIFATTDLVYSKLLVTDIVRDKKNIIVVDFWRLMSSKFEGIKNILYVPFGRCVDDNISIANLARIWKKIEN